MTTKQAKQTVTFRGKEWKVTDVGDGYFNVTRGKLAIEVTQYNEREFEAYIMPRRGEIRELSADGKTIQGAVRAFERKLLKLGRFGA